MAEAKKASVTKQNLMISFTKGIKLSAFLRSAEGSVTNANAAGKKQVAFLAAAKEQE